MRLPTITWSKPPVRKHQSRPTSGERGSTGTLVSGGVLYQEDHNPELNAETRYDTYDKMRRSDATIAAALRAIKLPLLRTMWTVDPYSNNSIHREHADFVASDLFNMTTTWDSYLRHVLLALDYGSFPFEKVWEIRDDNKVHLRKLGPRHPSSIIEWRVDASGGFNGFVQQINNDEKGSGDVYIPPEKALVFVHDQECSDYRGNSLLRPAYKHWYFKKNLETIDAISKERRGTGIDRFALKESASEDDKDYAESVLMTLRSHERSFLTYPEDRMEYGIEGVGTGSVLSALESVEHHDLRILRSMLTEFIAMGAGSTGSFAMHRDKTSLTLMALGGIGSSIAATHNLYLIPQMIAYNFPNVNIKELPRLRHARLDVRDFGALATAIGVLTQNNVLKPDDAIEDELREILELPKRGQSQTQSKDFQREAVDAQTLEKELDKARDAILHEAEVIQKKQTAALVAHGNSLYKSNNPEGLENVKIPFKRQLSDAVAKILVQTYRVGKDEASKELKRQGLRTVKAQIGQDSDVEIRKFLSTRARALSNLLGDRVASAFVWEMLTQFRMPAFEAEALETRLSTLSGQQARKVSNNVVSEALNLGRERTFRLNKDNVRNLNYSSVLDSESCGPCREADGSDYQLGDVPPDINPPNSQCEGGDRCRCIMVATLEVEGR